MVAQVPAGSQSLTRRLLLWSLGALVLVWGCFVVLAYRTGVHEADELTDGQLASAAALLLNLSVHTRTQSIPEGAGVALPWAKSHDYQHALSVVQWDAQQRVILRMGDAPLPAFHVAEGYANLYLGPDAQPWRSFSKWDVTHGHKVMVLLSLQERDQLAHDIAGQMIEPGMWLLPVVFLALGLAIARGLRPLHELSQEVEQLDVQGAQRLERQHPWREFDAVVRSVNTLLARQQEALARERELANEVAHELRTPLASMVLQAQALGGSGLLSADQVAALARIRTDALRAGHVLDQLLALARTSRGQWHGAASPVDVAQLVRTVVADYAQAAWEKKDTLSVDGPDTLMLSGHPVLLEMALRNLIENALRHTPCGTCIEVQCGGAVEVAAPSSVAPSGPWLQVCDDGARTLGAAASAPAAPADSLHLGHEIVARVAQVHGGRFAPVPAAAPFTTCYRLDFPVSALAQAR